MRKPWTTHRREPLIIVIREVIGIIESLIDVRRDVGTPEFITFDREIVIEKESRRFGRGNDLASEFSLPVKKAAEIGSTYKYIPLSHLPID